METLEIDALFEIDLRRAGRHQRPVPFVRRLEIVFVDGKKFGFASLLGHDVSVIQRCFTTKTRRHQGAPLRVC
jgi:hypothetical protein